MNEIALARPRDPVVRLADRTLIRAGAETGMLEEFRALAEATAPNGAPRYGERSVLEPLARFLVRGSAGTNKDAALYELCHLVAAVDACGSAPDRRNAFFLGPEAATSAQFQSRIDRALTKGGWRRAGFTQVRQGVAIRTADVAFMIHYSRMPFLAALYEFLAGMEDFAFFPEMQAIFDEMSGATGAKSLQTASNRVAGRLRQYRRRCVMAAQHDGRFDLILNFLMAASPSGRLRVDDESVLTFWREKSGAGDFRAYRTVFDAFVTFIAALEEAASAEASAAALPIGTDRTQGEIEPEYASTAAEDAGEWTSPLAALDEEPAAAIKFFKKEGERKPIEALMHHGPTAIRLPLAFLRLETFGPIQSAITTDLQVGRGPERVAARIGCEDAAAYPETVEIFGRVLDLTQRLQKAAFYALHKEMHGARDDDVDIETLDKLLTESAKIFRAIARKGFDEAGLADAQRLEGFRVGATALVAIADQIVRYVAAVKRAGGDLDRRFTADCLAFGQQFKALYGEMR